MFSTTQFEYNLGEALSVSDVDFPIHDRFDSVWMILKPSLCMFILALLVTPLNEANLGYFVLLSPRKLNQPFSEVT